MATTSNDYKTLSRLVLVLFVAIGVVCGVKSLQDVDLGWHLAGGLWMLRKGQLPRIDPFGAQHTFWWCYSWLFELIIALLYRVSGFQGLIALQALLVSAVVAGAYAWVHIFSRQHFAQTPQTVVVEAIAAAVVSLLSSPIWHLRPQLLSVLFLELILIACYQRWRYRFFVVLVVLWANIHVFWVAAPVSYFLLSSEQLSTFRRFGNTILLCVAGLLTPYGLHAIEGFGQYLFHHRVGYEIVQEFQSLSPKQGIIFFIVLVVVGIHVLYARRIVSQLSWKYAVLWTLFSVLSLLQIKYVAMFGVLSVPGIVLVGQLFTPKKMRADSALNAKVENGEQEEKIKSLLVWITGAMFLFFCGSSFSLDALFSKNLEELMSVSKYVCPLSSQDHDERVVLNHFNDGGWLELGWELSCPDAAIATTVDGRTLVMGEERLEEFHQLMTSNEDTSREILTRWKANWAVVPIEGRLAQMLDSLTLQGWTRRAKSESYLVFEKTSQSAGDRSSSFDPTLNSIRSIVPTASSITNLARGT